MEDGEAIGLYGTAQPVVPALRLSAGALSCELCEGQLRDVRWGDVEVVRGIAYLLRDRDWGTVPAIISDPVVAASEQAFDASFDMRMATAAGTLHCRARVHGHADGELLFEVDALPDAAIETNRCGFVVLHPAAAAGCALRVEHTDGRSQDTRFPQDISPSQPVFDIRELHYSPVPGIELNLRLEAQLPGDPAGKFEMEDQRNWSDASFKTYVASLLDPWPYWLPARQERAQRVCLQVRGRGPPRAQPHAGTDPVRFGAAGARCMPAIGVGVPPGLCDANPDEVSALCALGASWWLVEADLRDPTLPQDLRALARCRSSSSVRVQLDVIAPEKLTPDDAASAAAELCRRAGWAADAVRILPAPLLKSFQPGGPWPDLPPLEDYARAARKHFPRALIGGGMFTSYTELNRKRQRPKGLDFIGHLTCPIVHAPDDRSVMQTIEALPHIARSVRSIWPGLAYRMGPSCLAPRRNPYGEGTAANPRRERLALASVDPRHGARFGAAWTVAYAAAVASEGLDVLALHESHGPNGPFDARSLNAPPGGNAAIPAWHVLRVLAAASGARWVPITNLPEGVSGVAWTHDGTHIDGLLANTTPGDVQLRWDRPICIDGAASSTALALGAYQCRRLRVSTV